MEHLPYAPVPTRPFPLRYAPQKIEEDAVLLKRQGLYMARKSWPASAVIATDGGVVGRVRMMAIPKMGLMSEQGKPMEQRGTHL